jgi:hypothetical protein
LLIASLGSALFPGSEDRLGRTFRQGTEAFVPDQTTAEILKRTTGRLWPTQTGNPNQWFKEGHSFRAGHLPGSARTSNEHVGQAKRTGKYFCPRNINNQFQPVELKNFS